MQKVDLTCCATPQARSSNVNSAKNLEPGLGARERPRIKQFQIHTSKLEIPNSLVREYLPPVLEV